MQELIKQLKHPGAPLTTDEITNIQTEIKVTIAKAQRKGTKALRADGIVSESTMGEKVYDVTVVHSSTKSAIVKQLAFYADLFRDRFRQGLSAKDCPSATIPSPKISKTVKDKTTKYQPLIVMAEADHALHRRSFPPSFLALAISHRGELAPDFFRFIEFLRAAKKKNYALSDRVSGLTPSVAAAIFKKQTLDGVYAKLANGWGQQLRAVGFGYCKTY